MAIAFLFAVVFVILVIVRVAAFIGRDGVVHYPVRSMRRLTGAGRAGRERPPAEAGAIRNPSLYGIYIFQHRQPARKYTQVPTMLRSERNRVRDGFGGDQWPTRGTYVGVKKMR